MHPRVERDERPAEPRLRLGMLENDGVRTGRNVLPGRAVRNPACIPGPEELEAEGVGRELVLERGGADRVRVGVGDGWPVLGERVLVIRLVLRCVSNCNAIPKQRFA